MSSRVMESIWTQRVWKIDEKWVDRDEQGAVAAESLASHGNEAVGYECHSAWNCLQEENLASP